MLMTPTHFKGTLSTRVTLFGVWLCVMCMSTPLYAGVSASNAGTGIVSLFDEIKDFLSGPLLIAIASIACMAALAAGYFGGASDAVKKFLYALGITAGIIATPGLVMKAANAAGAVI